MNIKKMLFILSSVGVMTLTSCGGSGLRHPTSDVLKHYKADLNHDGRIHDFELEGETIHEDNLTWREAYDTLISEANSMPELNAIATSLGIDENEPKRTSLARYEVLHEAEELLMSTGAVVPLYNYGDPYLLKPNISGIYTVDLGYKYLDQLKSTDGRKDFTVSVGTKAETFDVGSNSDVSTCLALNQIMVGAKRYVKGEQDPNAREGVFLSKLENGICTVKKHLVTSDSTKAEDTENYIKFDLCPDLMDEMTKIAGSDTEKQAEIRANYELTARYTLEVKDGAVWNDGSDILADDFIYEWARASSGVYNGQAFGIWCNMFDMIRGYNAWNTIGQQSSIEAAHAHKSWSKLSQAEQIQYDQSFVGYGQGATAVEGNGCAGGMAGVIRDNEKQFTVQLINDCDYFESVLAFTAYMPVAKKNIIPNITPEYQKTHICKERGDWWLNKNGDYLTNGPMQIDGPIDNNDGGGINFKKATHATPGFVTEDTISGLHFKFIDKDSTIYDSYKSGTLQLANQFPSSVLPELEKKPDWCVAQQVGLFFYSFNVNDNTFDLRPNTTEEDRENLRKAARLLINRDDIAYNVSRKGSTPANGFVSDGVVESCIPVETTPGSGVYVAKKEGDEYVTANWHSRNKNMYEYLINPDHEYEYNEHIMSHRNDQDGGFYPTTFDEGMTEEEVMKQTTDTAIELAKKAGVHYNKSTGKFTNFPRISIITNNGSGLEDIAERLQAYYSLWGIDVTINTMEWQSFTATRRNGDYAFARQGWVADYSDARTYLDLCVSDSGNNDTQLGKKSWHSSH